MNIINDENKTLLEDKIFEKKDIIEISRNDIFIENNVDKKILKILMWGYPSGGRGKNIQKVLDKFERLKKILKKIQKDNQIDQAQADLYISELDAVDGLGMSTWSKFLYFFEVSIDSNKCQIFDQKIVASLNKCQFEEIKDIKADKKWTQKNEYYYEYLSLMKKISNITGAKPDQVELFFFLFNLGYKFI